MAVVQSDATSAREAGLRYVTDTEPGITREPHGPGFRYRDAEGRRVDEATRRRIRSLVIPPAWTHVWIARDARAHIQATGRDARGRKQYRYHPDWSAMRDVAKYDRLRDFGRALPIIRRRVAADLRRRPLSRPWVLATVTRLLESTVIRVGNTEYRRTNGSYGLTTLLKRHVDVRDGSVLFRFRAKSGIDRELKVDDGRLARRLRTCKALPGRALFQYVNGDGRPHPIAAADVNAYLHAAAGETFSAKDFRTWIGTLEAARALDAAERRRPASTAARKRELLGALDEVAARLGNTRAVCRKCYVHPAILAQYVDGRTLSAVRPSDAAPSGLTADERALLALLETGSRARRRAS